MGKMVLWKGSEPRKPTTRKVGGGVYSNGEMGPGDANTVEWRGRRRVGGQGGGWGAWCTAVAMGVGCVAECAVVVYGVRGAQRRGGGGYGKSIIQSREHIIIHEVDKNGLLFDVGSVNASGPPGWQCSRFDWDGTAIDQLDGLDLSYRLAWFVSASVSVSEGSDAVGLADVVVASVKGLTRRGGSPSWALLLVSDRWCGNADGCSGNGSERQWAVMPMDVVAAVVGGNADGCSGSGTVVVVAVGTYRCSGAVMVAVVVAVAVVAIGTYRCSGAVAVTVVVVAVGTYGCSGAVAVAVTVREMVVQYGCFIGIISETAMWYGWVIGDVVVGGAVRLGTDADEYCNVKLEALNDGGGVGIEALEHHLLTIEWVDATVLMRAVWASDEFYEDLDER
ncbi:hypothetical protein BU17DRAFT_72403 [Hysterangium stoloniferum]|nr:hypothetical protein BU17DRAFT_72403 [Hysterangium stoloniferum]